VAEFKETKIILKISQEQTYLLMQAIIAAGICANPRLVKGLNHPERITQMAKVQADQIMEQAE